MQIKDTILLKEKGSMITKIILVILASTALIAEILPEIEAKLIVIPTLILAIFICIIEIVKYVTKYNTTK